MYSSKAHTYFLWLYIKNLIVIRYRGAYLGLIWNVLQPLLYLLIMGFVFATFNSADLKDYVLYLFAGLIPWRFFEQAALTMIDSIVANGAFTKKIRMPHIYFPLIQLGISCVDFLTAFGLLLALFFLFQTPLHLPMIILPLSIAVWIVIAAGCGIILSVLFVFFQDLKNIVQMSLMLLLFTSTIFFKPALFASDPMKLMILKWDPVCYWVSLFQKPIYFGQWPGALDWLVSVACGALLVGAGLGLYRRYQKKFYYYM